MEHLHTRKFENKLPWFTLLSLPAIYVWFLYCYELGYAAYFKIPYSLVSVKITEYYSFTTWNALFIGILVGMILLTGLFYDFFYKEMIFFRKKITRVYMISGARTCLLLYALIFYYTMTHDVFFSLLYVTTLTGLLVIFFLLDRAFINVPAEITEPELSVLDTFINRSNAYTYYICTLIVQMLIYIPMLYFAYGYNTALNRTGFLSATIDGNKKLVVALYDACTIVKSPQDIADRNTKRFTRINIQDLNGQELEWTTVTLKQDIK